MIQTNQTLWPIEDRRTYADLLALLDATPVFSRGGIINPDGIDPDEWAEHHFGKRPEEFGPTETCGEYDEREPKPIEAIDDPFRLARIYRQEHGSHDGKPALHWHRSEWFRFDDYAYERLESAELRATLTKGIKDELDRHARSGLDLLMAAASDGNDGADTKVKKVTARLANDTMRALEAESVLPGRLEQPAWIGENEPPLWPAHECVVTRSGIVHVPSVGTGENAVVPLTPDLFSTNVLPYGYDPDAQRPEWLKFLCSIWSDDSDSIQTLQEWFGLNLVPDTRHHKLLILIGPPRSGKGTAARVLRGMIGAQNLASPTLSSLSGPFGLWPLLGKLAALVADARLSKRTDAIAVVERLLSISGEDPQDIARKNLPTLTGVRLPTRFTLMTNELPNMEDASGALMTRVILLRLTQSFTGREDKHLGERLSRELPGILNWAIEGYQRLSERGYFVQPKSGQELLTDLAEMASPITAFIDDECHLGPEYEVSVDNLFAAWQQWCTDHGRDHPGTQQTFGRDMRAARPELNVRQRRVLTKRIRTYEGICLRGSKF